MQKEDPTLVKNRNMSSRKVKDKHEITFKDDILHRFYESKNGKVLKKVVHSQPLHERVMGVAHDSIIGGHIGVQKTLDKITSNFYWPGIHGDVTSLCRCDICQKTISVRRVSKVPLELCR